MGIGHPKWFIENTIDKGWKAFVALSGSSSSTDNQKQSYADNDTKDSSLNQGLKVVGVGYGRTGTYSLALALDELGLPTLVSTLLILCWYHCIIIVLLGFLIHLLLYTFNNSIHNTFMKTERYLIT